MATFGGGPFFDKSLFEDYFIHSRWFLVFWIFEMPFWVWGFEFWKFRNNFWNQNVNIWGGVHFLTKVDLKTISFTLGDFWFFGSLKCLFWVWVFEFWKFRNHFWNQNGNIWGGLFSDKIWFEDYFIHFRWFLVFWIFKMPFLSLGFWVLKFSKSFLESEWPHLGGSVFWQMLIWGLVFLLRHVRCEMWHVRSYWPHCRIKVLCGPNKGRVK